MTQLQNPTEIPPLDQISFRFQVERSISEQDESLKSAQLPPRPSERTSITLDETPAATSVPLIDFIAGRFELLARIFSHQTAGPDEGLRFDRAAALLDGLVSGGQLPQLRENVLGDAAISSSERRSLLRSISALETDADSARNMSW